MPGRTEAKCREQPAPHPAHCLTSAGATPPPSKPRGRDERSVPLLEGKGGCGATSPLQGAWLTSKPRGAGAAGGTGRAFPRPRANSGSLPPGRMWDLSSSPHWRREEHCVGFLLYLKTLVTPGRAHEWMREGERKFPDPNCPWEILTKLPALYFPSTSGPTGQAAGACQSVGHLGRGHLARAPLGRSLPH